MPPNNVAVRVPTVLLACRGFINRLKQLERTIVSLQLEVAAALRDQGRLQDEGQPVSRYVSLGITMPLMLSSSDASTTEARPEVRLQVETGSGLHALRKAGGIQTSDRAPHPLVASLTKVAAGIDKHSPGDKETARVVLLGQRRGFTRMETSLQAVANAQKSAGKNSTLTRSSTTEVDNAITEAFPGTFPEGSATNRDHLTLEVGTDEMSVRDVNARNEKAKKFFARAVEQVTVTSPGSTVYTSHDQMFVLHNSAVAAAFNAFAPTDPIAMKYVGPAAYLSSVVPPVTGVNMEVMDVALKGLLHAGSVTDEAVLNTARAVFNDGAALPGYLQTALLGLSKMLSLVSPTVEREGGAGSRLVPVPVTAPRTKASLFASATGEGTASAQEPTTDAVGLADNPIPLGTRGSSGVGPMELQLEIASGYQKDLTDRGASREEKEVVAQGMAELHQDIEYQGTNPQSGSQTESINGGPDDGLDSTDSNVIDGPQSGSETGTPHDDLDSTDSNVIDNQVDNPQSGSETESADEGPDNDLDSTDFEGQGPGVRPATRRTSNRSSSSDTPVEDHFSNVKRAITATDWKKPNVENALVATRSLKQTDLVLQEVLPTSALTERDAYEATFERTYPDSTITKASSYFVKLIDETTQQRSMVYMANHARADKKTGSSGPNCRVTVDKRDNNTCLVKFIAVKNISENEELTHNYIVGMKAPSQPMFSRPEASMDSPPSKRPKKDRRGRLRGAKQKASGRGSDDPPKEYSHPCDGGAKQKASGRGSDDPPKEYSHPCDGDTMLRVKQNKADGTCFFSSVADGLNFFKYGPPGEQYAHWTGHTVRIFIKKFALEPQGEMAKEAVRFLKDNYDMQTEISIDDIQTESPEILYKGQVMSFEEFVKRATTTALKVWANHTIVNLVQRALQLDLHIITRGKWFHQKWTELDEQRGDSPRTLYLLKSYDDDDQHSTAHFEALLPVEEEPVAGPAARTATGAGKGKGRLTRAGTARAASSHVNGRLLRPAQHHDSRVVDDALIAQRLAKKYNEEDDSRKRKLAEDVAANEKAAQQIALQHSAHDGNRSTRRANQRPRVTKKGH